ncbi:DeoR/GlpR family DNA-binding transcription regulator [Bacillus tianshenii]|uniref:DeoR/GlpR family DNA-binding transcription regulator n=1 Tax=Sutcliffiella tianshenii TaxID=1463404 RepID=UPI001CD1B2A2|nr:DeoR/GlpR family DNA-binding transcription regulator [Bacillus tianshenii]MCA1321479.1 DeoR/GlpR family DNA-binding transcription regulator [Bacillus tianshenii]
MLTPERQQKIIDLVLQNEIVKLQELVDITGASESTIRRDLSQLEEENKLKRVHGGAAKLHQKGEEPSILEKSSKNLDAKMKIARAAAQLVKDGDCIFLDAGTTTYQMIPFLEGKRITVVTNGFAHIQALMDKGIPTYIVGGFMKNKTGAIIGRKATESLEAYNFDKAFIGANGVHLNSGYTTPDPEEAAVKSLAMKLSQEAYVLADETKINEVTFAKVGSLHEATIITNTVDAELLHEFEARTSMMVVESK